MLCKIRLLFRMNEKNMGPIPPGALEQIGPKWREIGPIPRKLWPFYDFFGLDTRELFKIFDPLPTCGALKRF